jgi:hypothetical protein
VEFPPEAVVPPELVLPPALPPELVDPLCAELPPEDFPPLAVELLLLDEHPKANNAKESPNAPIANDLGRWELKFLMIRSCSLVLPGLDGF